ncbi:phage tail tape measure protein [Streptococcus lutetiensis]|uniref:phage tail tape measure protein n=1 Tax=Streptococcus lutetiensis TaxID=150055 RepID=UPI001BD95EBF|nr:phage tail tape measure protein [Streptococcus lutetiensis]MBT0947825.1 phage tail tape measure protein [Streptococcus lutetiensis]
MSNIGKLVATATLDIAPFMTNTRQLKTYMKGVDSSLKAVENSFKGQKTNLNNLKTTYNQTGQSLKAYQTLLKQQSENYNQLKAAVGDLNSAKSEERAQLVGARSEMVATAAKVAELQSRLQSLATEMNVFSRMGSAMTNFGNTLQSVGGKMTGLGNTMTVGVTAPIVAGVGAVVKSAMSWESAFAGVKKTNDEVVDSNGNVVYSYADLESGLRGLTAQLPASHEEIAGVAEAAGQLGIKSQDVVSFTKTMIDMGESTNLSAEDAASAIAKIANITGLTSDEYQRFGSSVVALGNNFATTESDIVSMANRLAASGTLAGLTNQEILGLATAMSSVGIEAEAGGTAMTQTLAAIESAVAAGGEDLQKFATVAGESAQEFADKWENHPIEAIQDFIRGLGKLDEKGESATMVLDDMQLSGVRQSNMLKSLALAADTMTGAVDLSNKAWSENTALTNEASTRYETTESKLKMLKNQVVDMAIDFGGPFVDALKNGLEASKPLIQTLSDMAKKFNELSPVQQQHIMKLLAISAAAGPALSVLGKLTTGLGSMFKVFGSVNSGIGKLITGFGGMSKGSGLANSGVGELTTGLGGMSKGFGLANSGIGKLITGLGGMLKIFGPVNSLIGKLSGKLAPIAADLAGVGTAAGGLVGWTAALAGGLVVLANAKQHATEQAQKYGATLSGETKGALDQFGTAVTNTKIAMTNFETGAVQSADNVKTAVADMMKQITQGAEDSKARIDELAQKFGFTPEQVAAAKAKQDQIVSNAQAMADQITSIYEKHNGDVSKLTTTEKTIVENNMKQLCEARVKELNLGKSKEKAVLQTFNGEIGKMSMAQLKDSSKALQTAMKEEQKAYKDQRSGLKESLEQGIIDQQEYNTRMAALKEQHKATMSEFGQALVKIAQEQDAQSGQFGVYAEKIRRVLADYDMSFEDLSQRAMESANKIGQHTGMIGTYTSEMSADARNATDQWNALTLDPLTGELKTNAVQEVTKALTAENGWNDMEFILKNANVNSNARVEVADALQKLGEWDKTTPEQKELLFQNDKGLLAIYQSKDQLDIWNGMPTNVKELLCEDKNFTSNAERAKEMLNKWNSATPDQKDLIAHNQTSDGVSAAIKMLLTVPDAKDTNLTATDNTADSTSNAQRKINNVNQKSVPGILASDLTGGTTGSAQRKINNVNQKSVPGILASDLTGEPTSSAKRNLRSVRDKTVTVTAVDNASGVISNITRWLGTLKDKVVNVVTHHTKNEKGTNFHPGGLALVNDQKGGTYRELITLPDGTSFIPKDRNVMLPLPRGSKVLPANKTKQLFPRYANGIGFENTRVADVARRIGNLQGNSDVAVLTDHSDNSNINQALNKLIELVAENTASLDKLAARQIIIENYMDTERVGRSVAKSVTSEQERQESIKNAIYGKGW